MIVMVLSGAAWLTFVSLASAFVQTLAPDWVRARVLSVFAPVERARFVALLEKFIAGFNHSTRVPLADGRARTPADTRARRRRSRNQD